MSYLRFKVKRTLTTFTVALTCVWLVVAGAAVPLSETVVPISRFGLEGLSGWEEKVFEGQTRYSIVKESDGQVVLEASTRGGASGLVKKVRVDLTRTPFLNWSWKANNTYSGLNEKVREGDDYPARLYVVVSGGAFFWRTRALNYVWASTSPRGDSWPNAYTGNARMVAVRSRQDTTGTWYSEKRDIPMDFKEYFGIDVEEIHAVAIMTDSDQSKQEATAWYSDIYFSSN